MASSNVGQTPDVNTQARETRAPEDLMQTPLPEAGHAVPQDQSPDLPEEAALDAPSSTSSSRRRVLALGAALAGTLLVPRKTAAQRVVRPQAFRPRAAPATGDSLLRLVRRVTNGVTPEELATARSMGFNRYLEYQLNYQAIDDSAVDAFVQANYPVVGQGVDTLYSQDRALVQNQFMDATVYRAAFSRRQLYERMVNFWTDHFNILYEKVNYLMVVDQREVIRANALGSFPEMLRASAHSPAMLEYLDNTRSRRNNVNQNYAREIMELHTLGVDGGYTQTDVEEVTRALTGWTLQGRGTFRFDPNGHDFGEKTVLGTTIPAMPTSAGAAGIQDGEQVLDMLLAHPSTARFISYKMIRWLLRYDPPEELVDTVAATFTRTNGDIKSMIRDIVRPANLLAAPMKYRQPYQLVLASLRATQPRLTTVAAFRGQLNTLGQPLYNWADPDGWPDRIDWWGGMILQRWNYATYIATRTAAELNVDVAPLMTVNTADGIAEAINQRVYGGSMSSALKQDITAYLARVAITQNRVREALALAMSSNEFQWF
jgi:uncharacterized protein (DUF1800 family)